jgi:anaerobic selenocysteine-containing dehydrogenase
VGFSDGEWVAVFADTGSIVIRVEVLPTLPSSKIDRKGGLTWLGKLDDKSLEQLEALAASPDTEDSLTGVERSLQLLWHEALNVDI